MFVVQQLSPKPAWVESCLDLSKIFISKVKALTMGYAEVKVMFDTYDNCDKSLKKSTRDKRKGKIVPVKYKVMDDTNIKGIAMAKFLSHEETKHRLTCYLGKKLVSL